MEGLTTEALVVVWTALQQYCDNSEEVEEEAMETLARGAGDEGKVRLLRDGVLARELLARCENEFHARMFPGKE